MSYIDGFVVPVPEGAREAYRQMAADTAPLFKEFGAVRHVEAWPDDVPHGQQTDFYRAVNAEDGEAVVFSWIEYPSRAARDAANEKVMSDPRMEEMMEGKDMPFDLKRMIYGGFEVVFDDAAGARGGYVDGSVLAAPADKRAETEAHLDRFASVIKEQGPVRMVRAWADDVPDGKVTDFKRAVAAKPDESVVFMWIEWKDRAARDAGWAAAMSDPRMAPSPEGSPFDGKRQVFGGFVPIVDA